MATPYTRRAHPDYITYNRLKASGNTPAKSGDSARGRRLYGSTPRCGELMLLIMKVLIVSCSLNPSSRSNALCLEAKADLADLGHEVDLIDLRDMPLPFCDASSCYSDPNAKELKKFWACPFTITA